MMLSKSKLFQYLSCPYKFKRVYVDKVPTYPTPAMRRGSIVHKYIEQLYDNIDIADKNETWKEKTDRYHKKFMEECEIIDLVPGQNLERYLENVRAIEYLRLQIIEGLKENPEKYFYPVLREKRIDNHEREMNGIVDRVDLNLKDKLEVGEIKTTTGRKDIESLRNEMAFYKILLDESGLLDKPLTSFYIYFPYDNTVHYEEFTDDLLEETELIIVHVKDSIRREEYDPSPNDWCRFCQFKDECDKVIK